MLILEMKIKIAGLPFYKGSPAISRDPWLSVPAFRQVWLFRMLAKTKLILFNYMAKPDIKTRQQRSTCTDISTSVLETVWAQRFGILTARKAA